MDNKYINEAKNKGNNFLDDIANIKDNVEDSTKDLLNKNKDTRKLIRTIVGIIIALLIVVGLVALTKHHHDKNRDTNRNNVAFSNTSDSMKENTSDNFGNNNGMTTHITIITGDDYLDINSRNITPFKITDTNIATDTNKNLDPVHKNTFGDLYWVTGNNPGDKTNHILVTKKVADICDIGDIYPNCIS